MRGHQVAAARALLGLSQDELANHAGVAKSTVAAVETETGNPRLSSLDAIEKFFRSRGINFVDQPGTIGTRPQREDAGPR